MEDYKSLAAIAALPQWPVRLWTRHRKNAITRTRMLLLWSVAHNRTHTMGVYGNYEREKRKWNLEKHMDMEQKD
jgi:hypothetical protein